MYYEIHAHASSGQVQVSQGVHVLSLLFSSLDFFGTELLVAQRVELLWEQKNMIGLLKKKEKKRKKKKGTLNYFKG